MSGMRELKTIERPGAEPVWTKSVYTGDLLAAEYDSDGTRYTYLWGPDRTPLSVTRLKNVAGAVPETFAYHTDALGSVVALTDEDGVAVATYEYDPYGRPFLTWMQDLIATRNPLRYRAYYSDAETGMFYLPARYYDPATYRFLSPDPAPPSAGDPLSLNAFEYCLGDPVGLDDPSGADPPGKGIHKPGTKEAAEWNRYLRLHWVANTFGRLHWGTDMKSPLVRSQSAVYRLPNGGLYVSSVPLVFTEGGIMPASALAKAADGPTTLYHYGHARNSGGILKAGLNPPAYATTNGELTDAQAQEILSLRGPLRDCLYPIDTAAMLRDGVPVPEVSPVAPLNHLAGGGGTEVLFSAGIEPCYIGPPVEIPLEPLEAWGVSIDFLW